MLSSTFVMDRGIPTEAVLEEMRSSDREIFYLVGTPRRKIRQYEKKWLDLAWQKVRESVEVKLFAEAGELYVLAKSEGRRAKESAMRRKKLARLLRKLRAMQRRGPRRDQLLLRIGAERSRQRFSFPPTPAPARRRSGDAQQLSVPSGPAQAEGG